MIDVVLGRVDAGVAGALQNVIGNLGAGFSHGGFDLVGRVDPETRRVVSGAFAKNLGNDLWSVHLLDEHQMSTVIASELAELRPELGLSRIASGAAESLAVGPSALLEPAVGVTDAALNVAGPALGIGTSEAERLARTLVNEGVDPGNLGRIRREVIETQSRVGFPHGLEIER